MIILCRKYRAVTLIELLIVISIIAIISVTGFVSYQRNKAKSILEGSQGEISSMIKLAQSYALGGKTQSGIKPCGYGFRFLDNTGKADFTDYEIFYKTPIAGSDCANTNMNSFVTVESGTLSNGAVLSNFDNNVAETEIYFSIPFGKMFIIDGSGNYVQVSEVGTDVGSVTNDFVTVYQIEYPVGSGDFKFVGVKPGGYIKEYDPS